MTKTAKSRSDTTRRRAYSYLRFSTPEQRKGDSFRRQMDMAVAYATKHSLDLDHELTFHDVGVSAFRGQNADAGRLAFFLEAVGAGQVPQGSVLLVEQLDRLSRLTPRKAVRVLEDIVESGVSVVTLNDEREYTAESLDRDHMDFIISVLTFMRANEESATKSRRLKAAWEAKRANVGARPLTSLVPAWLHLSDDGRLEVIEERAELVRRMFALTLAGVGQHKIAATFNQEQVAPWGRGKFWHRSYVAKVLSNRAVIGTLEPHEMVFEGARKRRKPLAPVEGYYPAVVDRETFEEVQAHRSAVGAPQRGRHAHAPIAHFLAGLASCSQCGATMTRVAKGKRSVPKYVCSRAKTGAGCEYKSVSCELVERALLHGLPERLRALEGVAGADALDEAVEAVDVRVDHLREVIETLLDNLSHERSPALARALRDKEDEFDEAKRELAELRERQEAVTGLTIQARVSRALQALQAPEGKRTAADVSLALRGLFDRAVIDWPNGELALAWKHGGVLTVPYATEFKEMPGSGWAWTDEEEANVEND